jgi:hypothetical protein
MSRESWLWIMTANSDKPFGRIGPAARPPRIRPLFIVVIVVVVVIATIAAGIWTYLATLPCSSGGTALPAGGRACSGPPTPSPTTFIANGTVYTIEAGGTVFFQFYPSMATRATLNGSFTTTYGANVFVMTPGDFVNFSSAGVAKYVCSTSEWCFATGNVSSGGVDWTITVFDAYPGGRIAVMPWFFVMVNPNPTTATNVTWTTSLTATYEDLFLGSSETTIASPRPTVA